MILSRSHNAKAGPERFDGIIDAVLTTSQPIAVSEHYAKEGFEVTNVTATSVCVRGHTSIFERVFETEIYNVDGKPGEYANITDAKIDHPHVTNILGLENTVKLRPFHRVNVTTDRAIASYFSPTQIASIYNFPSGSGAGQKIGIVQLGGAFTQSDLNQYFALLSLGTAPTINTSLVSGGTQTHDSADIEVALDIDVIASLVPNATITIYFAPNSFGGFYNCIQAAGAANDIVSVSWGTDEIFVGSSTKNSFKTLIDSMGVPVCIASGDDGSAGASGFGTNVGFPASVPSALACGGTTLTWDSVGGVVSETVWDGSGGGYSTFYSKPSYQSGIVGGSYRGVPDVAGNADPSTGYIIRSGGSNYVVGGTSAVAPLWAALIARLNQGLGRKLALPHSELYSIANSNYTDITSGNNGAYSASSGWDAATGLGRPIGTNMLTALSSPPPPEDPAPTPTVSSVAPSGCPIKKTARVTFTGTNMDSIVLVKVAGVNATIISTDSTTLIATVPSRSTIGAVAVTFYTSGPTLAVTKNNFFTYFNEPSIKAISPTQGDVAGGFRLTVTGTFDAISSSTFGGTSVVLSGNSKQRTFTAPSHAAGIVNLVITNNYGWSYNLDKFKYVSVNPTISSVSSNSGHAGDIITITGTNLNRVNTVKFGSKVGKIRSKGSSSIAVIVPVQSRVTTVTVTLVSPKPYPSRTFSFTYV